MKRVENSGGWPAEKQENLGEKLRKVGKRGGQATPVLPFWRLQFLAAAPTQQESTSASASGVLRSDPPYFPAVSARKLAATIWELHHYEHSLQNMHNGAVPPPRLRRLQPRRHHDHLYNETATLDAPDPSPGSPDMPGSSSSLRRHIAASLMQHHRSVERTHHAIQPVSPASYGSSMEIAPYNRAVTPSSSIEFDGRFGGTSYSLKTSTELLKVLNRIWSLEEQHASNISLVKALKKELEHAHARIKELVRDQKGDRQEIDELMRQIADDKLVKKGKEQDRINSAIQSVKDELEDEKKLRRRSESLHRKLARELHEVKATLATALKDLDKERKSRKLLEELCDEFSLGIKDYEQELHSLRQKSDRGLAEKAKNSRLILHVSEAWLDERMQMKLDGLGEKGSVVDKLKSEIETFLQAKQNSNDKLRHRSHRRNSMESIPLNLVASAPRAEDNENDSSGSDSHCFELKKTNVADVKPHENEAGKNNIDERTMLDIAAKRLASSDKTKGHSPSKFEEQMNEAILRSKSDNQGENVELSKMSEICEEADAEEHSSDRKNKSHVAPDLNKNYMIDNLIRSHYMPSEGSSMPPENDFGFVADGNSIWRSHPSPVRQWREELPHQSNDQQISESSSKLPPDLKQNSLKTKLLEARTRGQLSRSRLKGSKISHKF